MYIIPRIRKRLASTFAKLTIAFISFGMIPVLLIGFLFISRYYKSVEVATLNNYSSLSYYISKNIQDIIESADDALGYIYDYRNDDFKYLYAILKNRDLRPEKKDEYINTMLRTMISLDENIASVFFAEPDNTIYAAFSEQGKILRNDLILDTNIVFPKNTPLNQLKLLESRPENDFCLNGDGNVFTLTRNYMDTSRVGSIRTRVLGTLYANISTERINEIIADLDIGESGSVSILNTSDNTYLFTSKNKTQDRLNALINAYGFSVNGEHGNQKTHKQWLFYNQIGNSPVYVIINLDENEILGSYFKNRGIMLLVLVFTIFILLVLYFIFSDRMSEPARILKKAMQQVQTGDLNASVEIKNTDEMGYLGEGFNKMVRDLRYYIDEMYVARLYQKEAELEALKIQIQPHYLYNTLDVIRMKALENDDSETAALIESLSKQLRYVISHEGSRVPLEKELALIREYFIIMKARYKNRFKLNINISEEDKKLFVMKLILQPAVENAIKHGLAQKKGIGVIEISARRIESCLEITVMDNGNGIPENTVREIQSALEGNPEPGMVSYQVGVGLKNIYERIKKRCGSEYGFTIASYDKMGTILTYRLPIWEEE